MRLEWRLNLDWSRLSNPPCDGNRAKLRTLDRLTMVDSITHYGLALVSLSPGSCADQSEYQFHRWGGLTIRPDVAKARSRASRTLPVIIGFAMGCGIGALCEATFGVRSLALPAGLALLAFAMGSAVEADRGAYPDGVSNIARAAIQRVDY